MNRENSKIIAVDFDGCIVEHRFPRIGPEVPGARRVIRRLMKEGHRVILWTCRSNYDLIAAIEYVRRTMKLELHGWNSNRLRDEFPGSPKLYADFYIDDKGLGCPLRYLATGAQPYVNWKSVEKNLEIRGVLPLPGETKGPTA